MSLIKIILRLYLPIIIFIILLIAIFSIDQNGMDGIIINFGFVSLPLPIDNPILAKSILLFITFLFLGFYYLFLDFSKIFPEKFELIVHFNDDNEVGKMINDFGITNVDGYQIEIKDENVLAEYFDFGDNELKKIFKYENYYSDILFNDKSPVETTGYADFKIKKMKGVHNYKIMESEGILNHKKLNEVKNKVERWSSKFNKISSANDIIFIKNIKHLFGKIILAPKFNQSIIINGKEETKLEHTLYSVSYIKPLPYPRFSGTIYFFKKENKVIPVGYAKNYIAK